MSVFIFLIPEDDFLSFGGGDVCFCSIKSLALIFLYDVVSKLMI